MDFLSFERMCATTCDRSTIVNRVGPIKLNLKALLPHSKRRSTSPVSRSEIRSSYSPERPSSSVKFEAKRRRELYCSVSEATHSKLSPNIPADSMQGTRMRTSFTYSQLQILEETFAANTQINPCYAQRLAENFQLPVECITSWFWNRRNLQRRRGQRRSLRPRKGVNELLGLIVTENCFCSSLETTQLRCTNLLWLVWIIDIAWQIIWGRWTCLLEKIICTHYFHTWLLPSTM